MDKDHVNGLEPQYEQMPEPERPDGEHQQQQIGQIAEIIQELEGAGFKFHEPPAKKTGQQDKFEQENVQMPAQQEMAGGRPYNGPERVIAEIAAGSRDTQNRNRGSRIWATAGAPPEQFIFHYAEFWERCQTQKSPPPK